MSEREQARQNIKADFDKDAAVDLLCARIDELEDAIEASLVGLQSLALTNQLHDKSAAIADVVRLLNDAARRRV